MFIKIPFESEIKFKTNISEITKMSLEHDFNVNDDKILGNFYVSGEYKVHSISINKEPFNYTLPFTVELREDIDTDTLEFNIEDFSYDVIDNDTLKVNIEYSLKGEERKVEEPKNNETDNNVEFERVNEEELNSELAFIDDFLDNKENETDDNRNEEVLESEVTEEKEVNIEDQKENKDDEKRDIVEEEKTIMETIKDSDDTFVTYHVHIIKESETLESVALMYNAPKSLLEEYNTDCAFNPGDKLLIPKLDE